MEKVFLYQVGDKFIRVAKSSMKTTLVKDVNRASTFAKHSSAISWASMFMHKYKDITLRTAQIKLELL